MNGRIAELPAQPAAAANPAGLARQNRQRERALRRLAKLRKRAADEIEKLLSFLDASDKYVMTEPEDDNDHNDASYPESGPQMGLGRTGEDDEPDNDSEPSLGSSGHGEGGPIVYMFHPISDGYQFHWEIAKATSTTGESRRARCSRYR
jgi:hypothetical protein